MILSVFKEDISPSEEIIPFDKDALFIIDDGKRNKGIDRLECALLHIDNMSLHKSFHM